MDFRDTPEEKHFRTELREWIAQHAPREAIPTDADAQAAFLNAWHRELYRAGYIGLSFPEDCGGHGKPELYDAILNDELGAAEAPPGPAIAHIANAIRIFGSDEQRRRHLPGLLSGEVRWCQGFSEPGAGSDLASLSTRAELEADGAYRVNGQKIWTSEAVWSDWCMLLAREPGSLRQKGISVLLVPLDTQGVDTREILTASGSRTCWESPARVGRSRWRYSPTSGGPPTWAGSRGWRAR
jgi:alkylation response protein AidB-like acyl-CoA dehydrogenase